MERPVGSGSAGLQARVSIAFLDFSVGFSRRLCRRLKPAQEQKKGLIGTTEVVPWYKAFKVDFFQGAQKACSIQYGVE